MHAIYIMRQSISMLVLWCLLGLLLAFSESRNVETSPSKSTSLFKLPKRLSLQHSEPRDLNVFARNNFFSPTSMDNGRKSNTREQLRVLKDFSSRDSRLGFARKVYSIFSAQALGTITITAIMMNFPRVAHYMVRNFDWISVVSFVLNTGSALALTSTPHLRHTAPWNFILLAINTLCQALMVGIFASFLDVQTVCLGTLHTLTALLAVTVYSWQPNPRLDLTMQGHVLLAALACLVIAAPVAAYMGLSLGENLTAWLLAMVFSTYIIYDTQLIIGNKHHKRRYPPTEYILAALSLYQDVVGLLMQVLRILADNKRRNERR